jgi:hypothetical protein
MKLVLDPSYPSPERGGRAARSADRVGSSFGISLTPTRPPALAKQASAGDLPLAGGGMRKVLP